MVLRFFDDFSIFVNLQDPSQSEKFTMENPIVNRMYFHGSLRFMKIAKSQKNQRKISKP